MTSPHGRKLAAVAARVRVFPGIEARAPGKFTFARKTKYPGGVGHRERASTHGGLADLYLWKSSSNKPLTGQWNDTKS